MSSWAETCLDGSGKNKTQISFFPLLRYITRWSRTKQPSWKFSNNFFQLTYFLSVNLMGGIMQHGVLYRYNYKQLSWNSWNNIFKPIFSLEHKIDGKLQGKMETKICFHHSNQISKIAIHWIVILKFFKQYLRPNHMFSWAETWLVASGKTETQKCFFHTTQIQKMV